jgi:hypothetical protein
MKGEGRERERELKAKLERAGHYDEAMRTIKVVLLCPAEATSEIVWWIESKSLHTLTLKQGVCQSDETSKE